MNKNELTICTVLRTIEFRNWFVALNKKAQHIVNSRIQRILLDDHWGSTNYFDRITELKWRNGLRVYCFRDQHTLVLLLGGNKNGQNKDIQKAKKIIKEQFANT